MSTIATSGRSRRHELQQGLRIRRLADHLNTGVGEQPGKPGAHQHDVIGDHHSHGITTGMGSLP